MNENYLKVPEAADLITKSFDLQNGSIFMGDEEELIKVNKSEYATKLLFALPTNKEIKEGRFQCNYNDEIITVNISKIQDKSQDPILNIPIIPQLKFNLHGEKYSIPYYAISDNRGRYPCLIAKLTFPYKLLDIIDYKDEWDEIQITGQPLHNKNKIIALTILNRLFPKLQLVYNNDMTIYVEAHYRKKGRKPIFLRLNYLVSKDAFKDAISEYYVGCKFSEIPRKEKILADILKEEDLLREVLDAVDIIKHYIENRYTIEAFWNDSIPKTETKIQPTLHWIFDVILSRFGIAVVRETHEGVGKLDFKFIYTTKEQKSISISTEFKLAHSQDIKHGLTKQLPAYLLANKSKSGIFVVMWFKDGKYFNLPADSKSEFIKFLENIANENKDFEIKTILIDASRKPWASEL